MTNKLKKHCTLCGSERTIKWGTQCGRQRYKCQRCHQLFVWRNKGKSLAKQKTWLKKWVMGRMTINEIAF
jgi:transposase-like protein